MTASYGQTKFLAKIFFGSSEQCLKIWLFDKLCGFVRQTASLSSANWQFTLQKA